MKRLTFIATLLAPLLVAKDNEQKLFDLINEKPGRTYSFLLTASKLKRSEFNRILMHMVNIGDVVTRSSGLGTIYYILEDAPEEVENENTVPKSDPSSSRK